MNSVFLHQSADAAETAAARVAETVGTKMLQKTPNYRDNWLENIVICRATRQDASRLCSSHDGRIKCSTMIQIVTMLFNSKY